jgi:hypothetical protein
VTDFLDQKYREISARTAELAPLVDEYSRLLAANEALVRLDGSNSGNRTTTKSTATRNRPARAPRRAGAQTKTPAKQTPAKPLVKGAGAKPALRKKTSKAPATSGGTRTAQALELVQGQPGITIPELANAMGIQQSYLYRVLPGLQKDGKIDKRGRGWHPKNA